MITFDAVETETEEPLVKAADIIPVGIFLAVIGYMIMSGKEKSRGRRMKIKSIKSFRRK